MLDILLLYYIEESNHFIKIDKCLLLDEKINEMIPVLPTNQEQVVVRSNQNEVIYKNHKNVIMILKKATLLKLT